jgi:hypothetical protein
VPASIYWISSFNTDKHVSFVIVNSVDVTSKHGLVHALMDPKKIASGMLPKASYDEDIPTEPLPPSLQDE